jgi:hypothetical protein
VIVVDLNLPNVSGLRRLPPDHTTNPRAKVIVITPWPTMTSG